MSAAGTAAILVYHRVTEPGTDPLGLAVSPFNLDEQLSVLRERFRPTSLDELARMLLRGEIRHRSVVVTFDDGYDSVLHAATPALERHEIPATAFVMAGSVGSMREFWWEELDRIVLHASAVPASFSALVESAHFYWRSVKPRFRLSRPRTSLRMRRMDARTRLYYALFQFLKQAPRERRASLLDRLAAQTDAPRDTRRGRRPLMADELRTLADGNVVSLGGHTISHPVLSDLPSAEQFWEMDAGASMLEQVIGRPVTSFAYPYGGRAEINSVSVAAARKAGFAQALANTPGLVRSGAGLHRLPRLVVSDRSGEEFERWLERAFAPARLGRGRRTR